MRMLAATIFGIASAIGVALLTVQYVNERLAEATSLFPAM